jgi:hypothetical protein
LLFPFYLFISVFRPGAERRAPIIGRTCTFDAKIYKIVDRLFNVSCCGKRSKKNFKIFNFCSALPSLLVAPAA